MNSPNSVACGSKPCSFRSASKRGQPVFKTTCRPTTTALHANRRASSVSTEIKLGMCSQMRRAAVAVECRRIIKRQVLRERAEAGVEVIVIVVDQLQRNDPAAHFPRKPLHRLGVAADEIPREQRVPAEQRIAGPLEIPRVGNGDCLEPLALEPFLIEHRLSLPGRVPKPREKHFLPPDQTRVGREHEIRQALDRRQQANRRPQRRKQIVQILPLLLRSRRVALPAAAHPGVDLVFDPVKVRRAHQNRGPIKRPCHRAHPAKKGTGPHNPNAAP